MIKKTIITGLLLLLNSILPVFALEPDKDDVYNNLIAKYGEIESVSVDFSLESEPGLKGKLKAVRGNKYNLLLGTRRIVCDGETIWNYSKTDKNVVISDYDAESADAGLEQFFFIFLEKYYPVGLTSMTESGRGSVYFLELEPDNEDEAINDIRRVKIWLSKKDLSIIAVGIESDNDFLKWIIENLNVNSNISSNSFKFTPPEGVEIIDFR